MVYDLSREGFELEIKSGQPVMMVFWAPWCGLCRTLLPVIEGISEETQGRFRVCRVNVEENAGLAREYRVKNVPAVYVFRDGKAVELMVGVHPKQELLDMLERNAVNVSKIEPNNGFDA